MLLPGELIPKVNFVTDFSSKYLCSGGCVGGVSVASNIIMSRLKQRMILSSGLARNSSLTSGHYSSTNSEARPDEPACRLHRAISSNIRRPHHSFILEARKGQEKKRRRRKP